MKVNLKNNLGVVKESPLGFSWTIMFFGYLVPLFRGDVKYVFIMVILALFTLGFSNFYFMFAYNGIYLRKLLKEGYSPADDYSSNQLKAGGYILQ